MKTEIQPPASSQSENLHGETVEMTRQCSEPGCEQSPGTPVDLGRMCLAHFIDTCYGTLEELSRSTHTWAIGGTAWESARGFVKECVQKATIFSHQEPAPSNLERARLVDIAIWATELGRRLRRSPRNPETIAIRLMSEKPGHFWEEETYALDISSHGARTNCRHALKIDDVLKVLRFDTGERLEARVVWKRQTTSSSYEIGIEFLCGGNSAER